MNQTHVDIDGQRISATIDGAGPPLLMIPGFLMSAHRLVETGLVGAFANDYQVIALDPLGHGNSDRPTDPSAYTAGAFVAHATGMLDHLGVERARLFGYSRGAQLARMVAEAAPERISCLVYGGNALFDVYGELRQAGIPVDDIAAQMGDALDAGDWARFWELFPIPVRDDVRRQMEERNTAGAAAACVRRNPTEVKPFSPVAAPTFALWGDGEPFHERNLALAAEFGLPHATFAGGHDAAFQQTGHLHGLIAAFVADNG